MRYEVDVGSLDARLVRYEVDVGSFDARLVRYEVDVGSLDARLVRDASTVVSDKVAAIAHGAAVEGFGSTVVSDDIDVVVYETTVVSDDDAIGGFDTTVVANGGACVALPTGWAPLRQANAPASCTGELPVPRASLSHRGAMRLPYLVLSVGCVACASSPPPAPPPVASPLVPPASSARVASVEPAAPASLVADATAEALVEVAVAPAVDAGPPAPVCPAGGVWIPPTGPDGFVLGKGIKGEHKVVLTHGFCMDESEVSVREYARCVEAGRCKEPWRGDPWSTYPTRLDYPVNMVSWVKAHAYCAWAGERLPTEAERESSATGPEQHRYPWGDEPEPSCDLVDYTKFGAPKWAAGADVGCGGGGPSPVGAHPKGDRVWPSGALHDMAGNLWEWVEDSFAPYSPEPVTDLIRSCVSPRPCTASAAAAGTDRTRRWVVTYRGAAHFTYQVPALGVRCVRGEPLATPSPTHE